MIIRSDLAAAWSGLRSSGDLVGNLPRSEKKTQSPFEDRNAFHSSMMPESASRSSVTKSILRRVQWKQASISSVRPSDVRGVFDDVKECSRFWVVCQHLEVK